MRRMAGWLLTAEKLFLFLITLGVVAYFILAFNEWAFEKKDWFTKVGDIQSYIIISVVLFVLSFVFRKLLIWQVRLEFGPQKSGRRRRR